MRPPTFDRDRRIAIVIILIAVVAFLAANLLSAFDVPYFPFRFAMAVMAVTGIFAAVIWVVVRHSPGAWLPFVLACAMAMSGLSLSLQLRATRQLTADITGLSTSTVRNVLGDSLAETSLGLLVIVTVSIFITASSARYTARQRAEELEVTRAALAETEERFRRAFEDGPIGMTFVDAAHNFARVNRRLCKYLGYSEDELIGKSIDFITHPDDREVTRKVASAIFGGDDRQAIEKRYLTKDGNFFWGRLTAAPIRDAEGKPAYAFGMIEDVSRRKQVEEELRRDQHFLRSLLDLQERERRFVAHEIHDGVVQQTVAAKMHLEAYLDGAASDETLQRAVGALDGAVREGRRMIGELRPMIIDDGGIVAAIEYLVGDALMKMSLSVDFQHDVRFGRLDPLLESTIFRITQEALINVWRHSESDKALVKLDHTDGKIHLEIQDWGIGFDPANVDPSRFGIRGLRERALLFGGMARIDSQAGAGTHVRVELPIRHADDPASPETLATPG